MYSPEVIYDLHPDCITLHNIFGDWLPQKSPQIQEAVYVLKKAKNQLTLASGGKKWLIVGRDRAIYLLDADENLIKIYCFLPLNKPRFENLIPHLHLAAVFQNVTLEDFVVKFGLKVIESWDDLDEMQLIKFVIPEIEIEVVLQNYDGNPKTCIDLFVTTTQFNAPYLSCIIVSVYEEVKAFGGSLIWTHEKCDMLVCEMLDPEGK